MKFENLYKRYGAVKFLMKTWLILVFLVIAMVLTVIKLPSLDMKQQLRININAEKNIKRLFNIILFFFLSIRKITDVCQCNKL